MQRSEEQVLDTKFLVEQKSMKKRGEYESGMDCLLFAKKDFQSLLYTYTLSKNEREEKLILT